MDASSVEGVMSLHHEFVGDKGEVPMLKSVSRQFPL